MKKALIALSVLAALAVAAWFGYTRWKAPLPERSRQERRALYYHCPMHPEYHSDHPGNCPICGMRLEPVYAAPPSPSPTGQIHITPEKQQLIGVQYGEARMQSASRAIRVVGKVAMDETRIVRIYPRVEGWIDTVSADFLGQAIRQGQPLLTIYSPELVAAQQEFLLAIKAGHMLGHSSMSGVASDNEALVEAARRRLELWDLGEAQIQELQQSGKPLHAVTLVSPAAGYVIARNAYVRQRVTPETELYTLADLSRVWVIADVFELDVASIAVGQHARVSLSFSQAAPIQARVSYIQPSIDPATRTLKVRLELDNPAMLLKPDMFVEVEFQSGTAARLMVPASAVLDSGLSKTVFLDRGDGYLEPRQVETGESAVDKVEIRSGLKAGDRIVTSGNFLIDSESQIKASTGGMHKHDQPGH